MSDKVVISIQAANGTKQTFEAVSRDSQKMGDAVADAGKRGAQGLDEMERSSRDLDKVKERAIAVGAAAGTIVAGISLAGQAYRSQEQQLIGLDRAYKSSADSMKAFAKELQSNTTYSDDAARQSEQVAATLNRNYGITADQIQKLISVTADLATVNVDSSGKQFDLVDAVQRTSSAIRGEAESAEALGLTMNDQYLATLAAKEGLTGWTTTMTDAEKAQFRLKVLIEQSTYAQGAAAEAADTGAGKANQLKNQIQDLTQEFGGALGPIGSYASVLGDVALAAPLVGAALGQVAGGVSAIGSAFSALTVGGGAEAAAYTLLGSSIGGVGLAAVAAAPGVGLLAYTIYTARDHIDEVTERTNLLTEAINRLNTATTEGTAAYTGRFGATAPVDEFLYQLYGMVSNDTLNVEYTDPITSQVLKLEDMFDELIALHGEYQQAAIDSAKALDINFAAPAMDDVQQLIDIILYYYRLQNEVEQTQMELNRSIGLNQMNAAAAAKTAASQPGRYYGDITTGYVQSYQPIILPPADTSKPYHYYGDVNTGYNQPYQPGYDAGTNWGYVPPTPSTTTPRYYGDVNNYAYTGPYQDNGPIVISGIPKGTVTIPEIPKEQPVVGQTTSLVGANSAANATAAAAYTAALRDQYGAYAGLVEGINSANDAQMAFKATQDGLLASERVYSSQIGEYNSQLNAQDAAYEILQKRQEDGVALTKQQLDFMANYDEANARGTAGVEDATIAQGELAQAYLLNMEKGDQMNAALMGTADATDNLVVTIDRLILSLGGVPDEVKTEILLDLSDESVNDLINYYNWLNRIPGSVTTVIDTVYTEGSGGSAGHERGALHGGVMGYARGGVVARMAEGNRPELLHFRGGGTALAMTDGLYNVPAGTYVTPAPATKQMAGGGNTYQFFAPLTIVANDPSQFASSIQEAAIGGSR